MPKVVCRHLSCPELVEAGTRYCDKHKPLCAKDVHCANIQEKEP